MLGAIIGDVAGSYYEVLEIEDRKNNTEFVWVFICFKFFHKQFSDNSLPFHKSVGRTLVDKNFSYASQIFFTSSPKVT